MTKDPSQTSDSAQMGFDIYGLSFKVSRMSTQAHKCKDLEVLRDPVSLLLITSPAACSKRQVC